LPSLATVNLDLNVLGFATLVSFLTGLVFGLFPALQAVGLARRRASNSASLKPGSEVRRSSVMH
jgi:hypothetical protein